MPELPEVEVVRQGLVPQIVGREIVAAEVRRDSCVRHLPNPADFAAQIVGQTVQAVARRGKFLWFDLGDFALSAHLGMSGQFRIQNDLDTPPHVHCRARLKLRAGGSGGDASKESPIWLDFHDQRTFGYLHVEEYVDAPDGNPAGAGTFRALLPGSVSHIGRDALDQYLDVGAAITRWRRSQRAIKNVLLDQNIVSGIGNIYADEALWLAQVHPQQPAATLSVRKLNLVLQAAQEVMTRALAEGGTSFDALYVNVNGESGYFSRYLHSYGRTGEPCDRCGTPIKRIAFGNRSSHFCPRCQRKPSHAST